MKRKSAAWKRLQKQRQRQQSKPEQKPKPETKTLQVPAPINNIGAHQGLWQDGPWLVVDLKRHKFPLRCLKTNQPVKELTNIAIEYSHLAEATADVLRDLKIPSSGTTLSVGYKYRQGLTTKITLGLPLEPRSAATSKSQLHTLLYVIGLFGIFLLIGNVRVSALSSTEFIFLAISIAALATGVYFEVKRRQIVDGEHLRGTKLWLRGAHPEWLSHLPPFPECRFSVSRYNSELYWIKWAWLGGSLATLVFAISVTQPGLDCYHALNSAEQWPKTTARILSSSLQVTKFEPLLSRKNTKRDFFDVHYTYEFRSGGAKYRTSTFERFDDADAADNFLKNHRQPDQIIEVSYNPRFPSDQRLREQASGTELMTMAAPVGLYLISFLLLLLGVQAWRTSSAHRLQSKA